MRTHVETISVRYGETDRMGVAHHSSYLLWFEIGRTGLLRAAGHPYRELDANGILLPVIEYGARFMLAADYDDKIEIETIVREIRSRVVTFDYVARRGGEIVATGFTRHACMDESQRARRFPDYLTASIEPFRR
ncbi:MAG TPA: thioesterase family protein [Candidatus Krumholzibacteria bacterium]|nr:thioesterase family protein [Candidatus Krumholzibacteria bacterium]